MKTCSACKQTLSLDSFNKKGTKKDGTVALQTYCRECNKIRSRKYYLDNRESHIKVIAARKNKSRQQTHNYICNYLSQHPCKDCGETNILVLEFDHQKDKKDNISTLVQNNNSLKRIKEEIAKCEVVCSNCHKIRTAITQKHYKAKFLGVVA